MRKRVEALDACRQMVEGRPALGQGDRAASLAMTHWEWVLTQQAGAGAGAFSIRMAQYRAMIALGSYPNL